MRVQHRRWFSANLGHDGHGAWQDKALAGTRALDEVLARKGVPATFDYWGLDVEHHWYWWQKMLRRHLEVFLAA